MRDRDDNNLLFFMLGFVVIMFGAVAGQRILDHHYPEVSDDCADQD